VNGSPFAGPLAALARQRGVLGAMVVSEDDGLIVDSNLQIGVRGTAVAALTASLYRKARLAAEASRFGGTSFLQLEAERGHVCAVGRDGLVLVAVAESRANVGLIRVEMLRALAVLRVDGATQPGADR
jgi:predicted regulator of Ras-like GTPase activity (Roadblock/LC7/MglB family)